MAVRRFLCWMALACVCAAAAVVYAVGGGTTPEIALAFTIGWQRGAFDTQVGSPLDNVAAWGTGGLIQRFPGATNASLTFALVKPDTTTTQNVWQMQPALYTYYRTMTPAVVGFPSADTRDCPALKFPGNTAISCQWQQFSANYALFAFSKPVGGVSNLAVRDPFYTQWRALGGTAALGPARSAEAQVTSPYYSQAAMQNFDRGAMYNITAGPVNAQLVTVQEPVYALYLANGAEAGAMGLPTGGVRIISGGMRQQAFERGAIEYNPATLVAVARPAIASLALTPDSSIQMHPDDMLPAQVAIFAADGSSIADRPVTWSSSNAKVVQILGSGKAITLKARGLGVATVGVAAEGQASPVLNISVTTAPCCQVGEGAPTEFIRRLFQDAVTRNKLVVQLPAAGVVRAGNGYVQQLVGLGPAASPYLVGVADSVGQGYVVAGSLLSRYLGLGGPSGALGYPLTDATAGGRQTFENGALAGDPLQVVAGGILSKWKSLGYETGSAGPPVSASAPFQTFLGTTGALQVFRSGEILAPASGVLAGRTFFVTGPVLASYSAVGGPGGDLGSPTGDVRLAAGLNRQDFEGGYIDYAPGDSSAAVHATERQPAVSAVPSLAPPGALVHLTAGGFRNGAGVRVSQTGQPDFVVTMATGTYSWDVRIPVEAAGGTVVVKAVDTGSGASAKGSYTVAGSAGGSVTISVDSGDQQLGAPGAQLALPLVALVRDLEGNPLPAQTVAFSASPGAQIFPASVTTDASGRASARMRLPLSEGISLATAQTGRQVATFSARSAAFSLSNFPALSQAVSGLLGGRSDTIADQGALLTAAASVLRYYQSLGDLGQPNGLADPVRLNAFLQSFCTPDAQGNQICDGFVSLGPDGKQIVNLWRAGAFAGHGVEVSVESLDSSSLRDMVAAGSPVILGLSLGAFGSHFVVATGIAADGSFLIADPNPGFAQTDLSSYLNGFTGGGKTVVGTLSGAVRLLPRAPDSQPFLVAASAPPAVSSAAGACGRTFAFPGFAAVPGATPANPPGMLYFHPCGDSGSLYQLDLDTQGSYDLTLTDLAPNGGRLFMTGSAAPSYQIVRSGGQFRLLTPAAIIAGDVVNAATLTSQIAPGSLISIYGAGFASANSKTTVQINGEEATVIAAFPFQVNALVPFNAVPGPADLSVQAEAGTVRQTIAILDVAPAIFSAAPGQAAISNQDNGLNGPSNPAPRGSAIAIGATGLGAVSGDGAPLAPVTVVIGGTEIPAASATLIPASPGVVQVNVTLPSTIPPGLFLPLYLRQKDTLSNTVTVSIE